VVIIFTIGNSFAADSRNRRIAVAGHLGAYSQFYLPVKNAARTMRTVNRSVCQRKNILGL
jgi:hypothetical protein